jgi:ankyrin repeat protein
VVKLLLSRKNVDVDSISSDDRTPLSYAAENGAEAVAKLLLETSAELESKDSLLGQAPLSSAAANEHEASYLSPRPRRKITQPEQTESVFFPFSSQWSPRKKRQNGH